MSLAPHHGTIQIKHLYIDRNIQPNVTDGICNYNVNNYFKIVLRMHIVTIVICSASPLKLVLSFGMDGPNVNKSILGKLDEKKEKCFKPTCQMLSCLIHVCHNSFRKGVKQYGDNAEQLCMNLY